MTKKFIIAIEKPTPEQIVLVTNIFRDKFAWWSWISGFWLVVDQQGKLNCVCIRDLIAQVLPDSRCTILEVDPKQWAGKGPSVAPNNMFDWLRNNWE